MKQWKMTTKLGPLYLVASEVALKGIYFAKREDVPMARYLDGVLARAVAQLDEYFAGVRREFNLPTDVSGTEFQKRVWRELSRIPYGKTFSYRDIAKRIGKEKATRAVGTANGRNPLSILVPCHRVIAADGSLGGYAGGLEIKIKLLELERGHA